jgi:hypothetical protein
MERSDIIYGVEVKIHCTFFYLHFLFSLLLEAIITPVTESPFCKINGTFDKFKKYAYLLWEKTRRDKLGVVWFIVFNVNNISVITWRSVLFLVNETEVPGENHWPAASHWQTLSHNVASRTSRQERGWNLQF